MQDILAQTVTFLLAGGRGERLGPLTNDRSKPAVPFGDRHIIDFSLANCVRSNITHPLVITQYRAAHLTQHVKRWWLRNAVSAADASKAPVCVPPPEREYVGNAEALFRNRHTLRRDTRYVLVLSADHVYDMDYRDLLRFHVERAADATLSAIVYPRQRSKQFGILEADNGGRVTGFQEKPEQPKELGDQPGRVLANMGIYVFSREAFLDAFRKDADAAGSAHDIGRDILPELVQRNNAHAFRFEDRHGRPCYWKDVGTIDSYYEASMEWLDMLPGKHRLAGSGSIIAEGSRIHPTAQVIDSIVMPGVDIGPGAWIHHAILDENVKVMAGAHVGYDAAESLGLPRTSSGIVVVPANSVIPPAQQLRAVP
jgi:glucose-1-phosphate adenylyltransferase